MWNEFKGFLLKTNAMALAIGVIIGAATGKVVSAIVADLLMPVISLLIPSGSWREAEFVLSRTTGADGKAVVNALKYGDVLGNLVDFIIIAFVVFLITKALLREKPAPTPSTKTCPECKEVVALEARRCKWCTAAF
ncbi:MAG: large conductance mechanosensitive channel protein MscL [Deltaproteobacteria bacterium]|nr:large conductance mechanosensitive channel protein MscL [Deltaproteobacteria bacterium]